MRKRPLPTPEYLHKRLRYEPSTGKLYWRDYPPHGPPWNGRWAGKEAATADNGRGYFQITLDGGKYVAHRIIWAMITGVWPVEVDHIDHDKGNNRIRNLRATTRTGNKQNQPLTKGNTSGVMGVGWHHNGWRAFITVAGKHHHLGYFDDFNDAVCARKAAEAKYGYHVNHGHRLTQASSCATL
jgi:hypothetical protein